MQFMKYSHQVFDDIPKMLKNSAGKPSGLGALLCSISNIASRISFSVNEAVRNLFSD